MQDNIKIEDVYPLLPAQRGFLVDSLAGEEDQYRQQICVEVDLTIPELKKNIRELVARNGLLRTVFDWSDGEPAQVTIGGIDPVINTFQVKDHDNLVFRLNEERAALRPVNDAPPIRFAIIENPSNLFLAITYHHILLDGPSINMLLKQILTGDYIPEVTADTYIEWLEQNVGPSEFAVWTDSLAGLGAQDGVLQGDVNPNGFVRYEAKFDATFYDKLLVRSRELYTTPAVHMQALWSEWALAYFGKESLLYGLVMSTRVVELSEVALGPYISTVPWLISKGSSDMDRTVIETSDKVLSIDRAKHIPLGSIAKYTSPLAMSFEAILTITTSPVRDTSLYKIVETYENTGYKLSVDIEISGGVNVSLTTSLSKMETALESFMNYARRQIDSSFKLPVHQRHEGSVLTLMEPKSVPAENQEELLVILAGIFDIPEKNIDTTSSFLELGGDSIVALRLKSLLKSRGLDVSIGDILQARSIQELATKIVLRQRSSMKLSDSDPTKMAQILFGNTVEHATRIPSPARAIVNAHRLGYGQDYHEQTAFRLAGSFEEVALAAALDKLALEYTTLRLMYPLEMPDLQVLTTIPRLTLDVKKPVKQSFDDFVRLASQEYWRVPLDIAQGPLLRVVVIQGDVNNWYLFMSFSALVTDGWSFATMLERLFEIYGGLLDGSYVAGRVDPYIEHSWGLKESSTVDIPLDIVSDSYSSEIAGEDFVIDKALSAKIFKMSKDSHNTISTTLLKIVVDVLERADFSQIRMYENGRDDPSIFGSVGPYSFLSSKKLIGHGKKQAYYVFENYPRESENRLRTGSVKHFNEAGNWRRDLLPPSTNVGYLFDVTDDTISVRVIVRKSQGEHDASYYWGVFLKVIEEE